MALEKVDEYSGHSDYRRNLDGTVPVLIKDQAKTELCKDFGLDIMIGGSSVISPDNHFKSNHTPVVSFLRKENA